MIINRKKEKKLARFDSWNNANENERLEKWTVAKRRASN